MADSTPCDVEVAPDIWIRADSRWVKALCVGLFAAATALLVLLAVAVAMSWHGLGDWGWHIPGLSMEAKYLMMAGIFAILTIRLARTGMRISDQGVCLRDVFLTRDIPLNEAVEFRPQLSTGTFWSEVGVALVQCGHTREHSLFLLRLVVKKPSAELPVLSRFFLKRGEAERQRLKEMQSLCNDLNELLQSLKMKQMPSVLAPEAFGDHL